MVKKLRTSEVDPEGFAIPEKMKSNSNIDLDVSYKENIMGNVSNSKTTYSKSQLSTRCRLYRGIKSAVENTRQKSVLSTSLFMQIYKQISNTSNSEYITKVKEVIKLILEGGGIPSLFADNMILKEEHIKKNLEDLIINLQENGVSILHYYPLRPKKKNDNTFQELFELFFKGLAEYLLKKPINSGLEDSNDFGYESLRLILVWLKGFCTITLRPLRHSSIIAVNGILKGMGNIKGEILETLERFRQQKKKDSKSSNSLKTINKEINRYELAMDKIKGICDDIVHNIWIERIKDIAEYIRLTCILTLQDVLLEDCMINVIETIDIMNILKMLLNDQSIDNRIACFSCIKKIASMDNLRNIYKDYFRDFEFLNSLKNMIIAASKSDIDEDKIKMGEYSISILNEILMCGFLEESFIDEIVDLLWLDFKSNKLSSSIALFINNALFNGGIIHENVESEEFVEILENEMGKKRMKSSISIEQIRSIDTDRLKLDLNTLLEFLSEFGKDYIILTSRCVNSFWSNTPCIRDTKLLVETILEVENSGIQGDNNLITNINKLLLLVLHSNLSKIQGSLSDKHNNPNIYSINDNIYRASIAIRTVFQYIEPLILVHEANLDNLTIILTIISIVISMYCTLLQLKVSPSLIPSNFNFPLQKVLNLYFSHSDPKILDGICMILSPLSKLEVEDILYNGEILKEIKSSVKGIQKKLIDEFISIGKGYLKTTDELLYLKDIEDLSDPNKEKKTKNKKNSKDYDLVLKKATSEAITCYRRIYAIIKYMAIDNIFLLNNFADISSLNNSNENMTPEQTSGMPLIYEILLEILERSERVINSQQYNIILYQTLQLYNVILDFLTTGYTHLVQYLLQGVDVDNSSDMDLFLQNKTKSNINKCNLLENNIVHSSTATVYKNLRHKMSCVLLEILRFSQNKDQIEDEKHICYGYLRFLSLSSFFIMLNLQGIVEENVTQSDFEIGLQWVPSDSDLTVIIKEYLYWIQISHKLKFSYDKNHHIMEFLVYGSYNTDKPLYILYPNCRVFEQLDNLKDEPIISTDNLLSKFRNKLKEFIFHSYNPTCILTLLISNCKHNLTSDMLAPLFLLFIPIIKDYISKHSLHVEESNIIYNFDKFTNSLVEEFYSNKNKILGIFTCIVIAMILAYSNKSEDKAEIIGKTFIDLYAIKAGSKKFDSAIKDNASDLILSIVEGMRYALYGATVIPVYRNIITRENIINGKILVGNFVKYIEDLFTIHNLGGNKPLLNYLATGEINQILEQLRILCKIRNDENNTILNYYGNQDILNEDAIKFLDRIANFLDKLQKRNKINNTRKSLDSQKIYPPPKVINKSSKNNKRRRRSKAYYLESNEENEQDEDIEDEFEIK
ncbi:hypothetical protein cand_027140 [Cryptosporidium andersoni]|uniref:STAG domain-containing protein n=1 Tax=Cryptosporidium andersoni TaxID=117008 RepID=A0A1J4MQR5_9CRYT|nr:hypothetical protein cand_027140 [Cryptosporidium andersoni]